MTFSSEEFAEGSVIFNETLFGFPETDAHVINISDLDEGVRLNRKALYLEVDGNGKLIILCGILLRN